MAGLLQREARRDPRNAGFGAAGDSLSPEWVAAIASLATFVVIGATALTALVQLRHMRNSNQIAVFTELRQKMEAADFQNALRFIRYELPEKLSDSGFRVRVMEQRSEEGRPSREIGNFLDGAVAPLVKQGVAALPLPDPWPESAQFNR